VSGELWLRQFHDSGKVNAGTKHFGGIGVPKLMRHDACEQADRMADLAPVIAQLTDESFFGTRPWQQHAFGGKWIERAKEAQTMNQFTDERVYRDHSFSLELAERNMDCPLIRADSMKAVAAQVRAFADPHAGMTDEEKGICSQIIAAR